MENNNWEPTECKAVSNSFADACGGMAWSFNLFLLSVVENLHYLWKGEKPRRQSQERCLTLKGNHLYGRGVI